MKKQVTLQEAVDQIKDGMTIMVGGFLAVGAPTQIVDALVEKGYNPINQIVGYILSEDPTYITSYNNARGLIRKLDRDELMKILVNSYLKN